MTPRGIRNNNPGNIEYGPFAQSAGAVGSDGRFAIFPDMNAGQMAIARLLKSYGKRGFNTPNKVINRWAPSSDGNNVGAYVNTVSSKTGIAPDQEIDFNDPAQIQSLVQAITLHENGVLPTGSTPIGTQTEGGSLAPVTPSQTGLDRLKSVLGGKSYNPDALTRAEDLSTRGLNIASTSGNPIGAIGGSILAGLGGYQRNQESDKRQQYRTALSEALGSSGDPMSAARLLMSSPDETLQKTGIDLYSRLSVAQQKAAEAASSRGLTPVPMLNKATGKVELGTVGADGTWQPLATADGYEPAPRTTQKDTGTEIVTFDVYGNEIGRTKKDVAGAAQEKKRGEITGEQLAQKPQARAQLDTGLSNLDRLASEALAIKQSPGLEGATGMTSYLPTWPGGSVADTEARLGTLKSQIAFGVLQAMRDASKTGGALGAVSEKELALLENNLAGLDTAQSLPAFEAAIDRIVNYTREAKQRLSKAYEETYGEAYTPQGGASSIAPANSGSANGFKVLKVE